MRFYVVLNEAHKAAFLLLTEGFEFSVQYHGVYVLFEVKTDSFGELAGWIAAHRVYIL